MGWNTNDKTTNTESTAPFRDADRGERLQRVMANGGIASRRKCEEMIEEGKVKVNGVVVDFLPAWVNPKIDKILTLILFFVKYHRHNANHQSPFFRPPHGRLTQSKPCLAV